MTSTLHSPSIYPEIITHTTLDFITKLTDYTSQAKQEAKLEAQRRNAEVRVLEKQLRVWRETAATTQIKARFLWVEGMAADEDSFSFWFSLENPAQNRLIDEILSH